VRNAIVTGAMSIGWLALILGVMAPGSPTFAAGLDSRVYSCADLQAQIAARRFVFINNPTFEDFAVADASSCGGGGSARVVRRSVPTTDTPECLVNYCTINSMTPAAGGG
jgi:hypothetical protein